MIVSYTARSISLVCYMGVVYFFNLLNLNIEMMMMMMMMMMIDDDDDDGNDDDDD